MADDWVLGLLASPLERQDRRGISANDPARRRRLEILRRRFEDDRARG
jgi:hypothetical protein